MDLTCESCGVANPAGTEFCEFCGVYLAWDRSILVPPPAKSTPSPANQFTPTPPVYQPQPPSAAVTQPLPTVDAARPGVAAPAPPVAPPPPPAPPVGPTLAPAAAGWSAQGWPASGPAASPPAAIAGGCPTCGRVNDPSLRFCAKCGQVLSSEPKAQQTAAGHSSTWNRISQSRDRAARRAYRHSLPPLYRWRRVIIGFLVVTLGLGGLTAVGRHPVRWAIEKYYDLRDTTVIVGGVKASVDPPTATATGSDPAALTDVSVSAWTMNWAPTEQGTSCGGAPGTGKVLLTVPATRIRQIEVQAGLLEADSNRTLEFRPESIGVSFDGGPCRNFSLQDAAGWQTLEVDSEVAVSTVEIGVDTAYAAQQDGAQPRLSITEISLRSRPPR